MLPPLLVTALALAAGCPSPAGSWAERARRGHVRYFLGIGEGMSWVEPGPAGELRALFEGSRLEARKDGLLLRTAWLREDGGEALRGAVAVPTALGGGFVHVGERRTFFSREFTGPLEEVPLEPAPEVSLRGARAAEAAIWVFGRGVTYEVDPRGPRPVGRASAAPALVDRLSVDGRAAVELDALGRVYVSPAGGAPAHPLMPARSGGFARGLSRSPESGRPLAHASSGAFEIEVPSVGAPGLRGPTYGSHATGRELFSGPAPTALAGARRPGTSAPPRSPLQAALAAGALGSDGKAYGAAGRALFRVDLASGKALSELAEGSYSCAGTAGPKGPLFACEASGPSRRALHLFSLGRGSGGSARLRLERSFAAGGHFVASDDGALGFVGPCDEREPAAEADAPRAYGDALSLSAELCVRKADGSWVHRQAFLLPGEAMVGWAARLDGGAVALVRDERAEAEGLGGAEGGRRGPVREAGGVRVVRVRSPWPGLAFPRPAAAGEGPAIDRTFRARDDGGVEGWLAAGGSAWAPPIVHVGFTLDPQGRPRRHALPEGLVGQVVSGDFGLAVRGDGALFETLDHGRTWREAGIWPLAPGELRGTCSRLGCAVEGLARVGWGHAAPGLAVAMQEPPAGRRGQGGRVRLACAPAGPRRASPGPGVAGASVASVYVRGQGDAARPWSLLLETRPPVRGKNASPPAPRRALLWRQPFASPAPPRRLELKAGELEGGLARVVPLLGDDGEAALLLVGSGPSAPAPPGSAAPTAALLLRAAGASRVELREPPYRHFGPAVASASGLLEGGRLRTLGEAFQRLTVEEAGGGRPTVIARIGAPPEHDSAFALTLGRREEGGVGLLALDATFASPGVASYDPVTATVSGFARLAPLRGLRAGGAGCAPARGDVVALVTLDPSQALELDEAELPRISLGARALARLRWGPRRVCLEALDARVVDQRAGLAGFLDGEAHLALRAGEGGLAGALVGGGTAQPLACRLLPPALEAAP